MKPDGLNELKVHLSNKIQKYHDNDAKLTRAYLEAMIATGKEARDVDALATVYSSYYAASEFNERKSYVLNTYTEEIEDKDLGLVRKINLN